MRLPAANAPPSPPKRRRYGWCRLDNEFPDLPLWRAVAKRARVPVHQVVAVVLRLECLANRSEPRGSVADMSVTEFAAALQLRPDVVARIRVVLEEPDISWLAQDFIVDFHQRNPDHDDPTAAERQRRHRAKLKAEREGSTGPPVIHSHVTSRCDTVTVTPHQIRSDPLPGVDNFGGGGSVAAAGPSEDGASVAAPDPQETAALWLGSEGTRIVTEQLLENRNVAARKIAFWRDQELGGDAAALAEIIRGAEKTGLFGATFLNLIVVGVRDAKRRATAQGELRLPVLASERKMG